LIYTDLVIYFYLTWLFTNIHTVMCQVSNRIGGKGKGKSQPITYY